MNLSPSRRYALAKALSGYPNPQELILALAEWERRESNETVRKAVREAISRQEAGKDDKP